MANRFKVGDKVEVSPSGCPELANQFGVGEVVEVTQGWLQPTYWVRFHESDIVNAFYDAELNPSMSEVMSEADVDEELALETLIKTHTHI